MDGTERLTTADPDVTTDQKSNCHNIRHRWVESLWPIIVNLRHPFLATVDRRRSPSSTEHGRCLRPYALSYIHHHNQQKKQFPELSREAKICVCDHREEKVNSVSIHLRPVITR